MEVDAEAVPTDARRVISIIWRRKWWIVAAMVATLALSLYQSRSTTKSYTANSTVSVNDPNQGSLFGGGLSYVDPKRFMATQLLQVRGSVVAAGVEAKLGRRYSQISSVSVRNIDETNVLVITVTSAFPQVAADGANAYAQVYVDQQRDSAAKAYDDRAAELQALKDQTDSRIDDLSSEIASLVAQIAPLEAQGGNVSGSPDVRVQLATLTSQRSRDELQVSSLATSSQNTQQQIDQLKVEAGVRREGTASVVDAAVAPRSPSNAAGRSDLLVAVAIGLVLGLALAFGREALGSTIESADDAERSAAGIPVLGYALHTGRARRHRLPRLVFRRIAPKRLTHRRRTPAPTVVTLTEPHSPGAEAYRALRTNIELARPRGVVLVTSATDEDGKSTTAANLAVSLATAGSSVIVVDCDLRRARMHAFFGLSGSIGLTSVLLGRDTLDDALQSVPDVHGGSLRVLASGPLPPQPSELLGSSAVGKLMDTLRSKADYVIVDTPPVLAVSDPAVASRWADDVLIVVNVGWTTQHQLETALERLDQAAAPVLGLVLNNLTSPVRGGYYYYGRRADEGDARPTVVAPEEWTRLVARPDVPNGTNGNGAKHHGEERPEAAEEGDDAWRRLAGLRASLDDPHEPEKGDVETS